MVYNRQYFIKHLEEIKHKAGARYTPELNVDLPISEIFDGISRTKNFYTAIREKYGELLRVFRYVTSKYDKNELQKSYNQIKKEIEVLFLIIESIKKYNTDKILWDKIQKQTKNLQENLWLFANKLRKENDQVKNVKSARIQGGSYQQSPSEKFNSDIHHVYKTQELIHYFEKLSSTNKAKLSNYPFLLLTGSAGTGKTHLLCDVVEHRIQNEPHALPSFIVFGEFFLNEKNFWTQFFVQLKIKTKTKKVFLAKLNALGEQAGCRTLLVIDALNENISHAPNFWIKNLDSIIQEVKKYPNIALVVSVRNGFENEVLTEKQKSLFIHEEHHGFRFKEWEAVNKFFKAFSLPLPEIPLLMPEFQNPLFLLLFCKAFQKRTNKKKKQIFRGHEGATYIFESFVLNATNIIAKKFNIQKSKFKSPAYRIWNEIIKEIASEMVNQSDEKISEVKLNEIIQKTYPQIDIGKFVQALETNMLVVKVPRYIKGGRYEGFDVRFPFQKFSDHLIGRYIFKKYEDEFSKQNKNLKTAKRFFSQRRKLGKFLANTWNRGIIKALSIQCPEQINGLEFIEVAPYLLKDNYLAEIAKEAFVESLIWRNPKTFSNNEKNTLKIINQYVIRTESGHNQLLNALLSVAPIPNHSFNAERLHQHLSKFSMPKRDSWWSTFLHYQSGEQGAVDSLLQWSWSDQSKKHLNDESIFLTSIILSWFLTTSNRFVRDTATKGLVCLLQSRIHLIPKLLEKFKDINDPYILERLLAVAYGCVLRNQEDKVNLKILAKWIYEGTFKDNKPPVHILLRDYARGIIEIALIRGVKIEINEKNINPPYKSTWPKKIPSKQELKKKYYPDDFFKGETKERDFLAVWSSVLGGGDFDRYIIGTNTWSCEWSGRKLKPSDPNRKEIFEKFKNKLSKNQDDLLKKAINPLFGIDLSIFYKHIKNTDINSNGKMSAEEIAKRENKQKAEQKRAYAKFENSLSKRQKTYFKTEIKPFLNDQGSINDPLETFDLKIAQRWIFNRVIKLGYNPKLHGKFDNMVNRYDNSGRSEHKAERIGKKYQWIAYHELMALISDHFEFKGDSWSNSKKEYKGPWLSFIRDIDTSFILQDDNHIKDSVSFSNWILKHGSYNAWGNTKTDLDWMKTNNDLPDSKRIIQIIDDDKKEWLILEGLMKWEEKTPPEYKKYDIPVRRVSYMVKSYIVKNQDSKIFFEWAKKQDFMGRGMPESNSFYELFLGEFPNSIAFKDLRGDYNTWTKIGRGSNDLQISVVVTNDSYLKEFTLDCSHSGSVTVKLPCEWIVNQMGLHRKYLDGRFFDKHDNLITITTSIFEDSFPSALLIDKKALIEFLDKNGYAILWTFLGEKQLIGGSLSGKDFAGRLEISGAYTINLKNNIVGNCKSKFKN